MSDLINLKEVMERLNLSRSTICRKIKKGEFPKPLDFSRKLQWKPEQIDNFIKNLQEREK